MGLFEGTNLIIILTRGGTSFLDILQKNNFGTVLLWILCYIWEKFGIVVDLPWSKNKFWGVALGILENNGILGGEWYGKIFGRWNLKYICLGIDLRIFGKI
jgi:hypothetical protein